VELKLSRDNQVEHPYLVAKWIRWCWIVFVLKHILLLQKQWDLTSMNCLLMKC